MSGCYFYIGNNLVSWNSKKQNFISLSTIKVKYTVTGSGYPTLMDEANAKRLRVGARHHECICR